MIKFSRYIIKQNYNSFLIPILQLSLAKFGHLRTNIVVIHKNMNRYSVRGPRKFTWRNKVIKC